MESVVLTHLTIPEVKQLFRQELQDFFKEFSPTQAPVAPDEWLGVQELSKYLNLSEQTIYQRNDIPSHKQGKKLRFLKSEIDAWLKAGRKPTAADAATQADTFLDTQRKRRAVA